jgi:tRNA-splicing ligase RtcB
LTCTARASRPTGAGGRSDLITVRDHTAHRHNPDSGNYYVDLMSGITSGSASTSAPAGFGHSTATKYLRLAGGKDGINVAFTVLDAGSDLGGAYLAGMELCGEYAYAGREWVVDRVRQIIGGAAIDSVHNHHNFA